MAAIEGLDVDRSNPSDLPLRMRELPKAPTGISGLDEVTGGGLPRGRSTLICGPAGCGKTLLAMEFLVRGISRFNEPGVFVAFEESAEDLVANFTSLGFDLAKAEINGQLVIDHVTVVRGKWRNPETGTLMAYFCGSARRSTQWVLSGSRSTPSKPCLAPFQTRQSCVPNCTAYSAGSRIEESPR